jgi:hypothetical protein
LEKQSVEAKHFRSDGDPMKVLFNCYESDGALGRSNSDTEENSLICEEFLAESQSGEQNALFLHSR